MKKASIMEAEARKQQQILQAQATAEALQIIVDQVKKRSSSPNSITISVNPTVFRNG